MRPATLRHGPTRRDALAALLLACGAPLVAHAGLPEAGRVVGRWASGNATLAPLTLQGNEVLFAGERTLGVIELGHTAAGPRWLQEHGLSAGAVFRPRVSGGRVVCGSLHELDAWDRQSGQHLWRHAGRIQIGVPLVEEDRVFVGDGHELVALDARTGATLWRFAATEDTVGAYAPVRSGDAICFAPGDGLLYAVDAASGRLRWQVNRRHEWQYLRQLQVSQGVLVAGSYKELLYGIDPVDGRVLWRFNAGNFINSQHVSGDTAYLWSPTGWLYAIDIHGGQVRWRHRTNDYRGGSGNWGPLMAELQVSGDRLYALDMRHTVHILHAPSGERVQRLPMPEPLRPTLQVLSGQALLLATGAGDIWRVEH